MTNNPLQPVASQSQALSSTPVIFAADPTDAKARIVRVWSNRQFHVATGGAASTDSLPVDANGEGALVHVDPGVDLSAVKGAGQPDGTVWATTVKRY